MTKRIQMMLFIAMCLLGIAYGVYQMKQLESNYLVTTGEVIRLEFLSKSTEGFVSYTFPEKSNISKSSLSCMKFDNFIFFKQLLISKKLPVVYQKNNLENSEMLFLQKDYKKYNITPSIEQEAIIKSIDSLLQSK